MISMKNPFQDQLLEALEKRRLHLDQAILAATEHGVELPPDLIAEFEEIQDELTRRELTGTDRATI